MNRPTDAELGWLAGIMDGEGTIALYSRPGKTRDYIFAHFGFASTEAKIAKRGRELLQALCDDPEAVRVHPMPRAHINPKWRDAMQIRLEKQAPLLSVLTVLLPHLVGKKENAEIVVEWLKARAASPRGIKNAADDALLDRSRNVMNFSRS